MEEIKPCPFCGAKAEAFEHRLVAHYYYVGCIACDAEGPPSCESFARAIAEWNTRQSASGEIEALEAGAEAMDSRGNEKYTLRKREQFATTLRQMAARMK